ncbi:MAG: GFA family protein [Nevskiaceae bacterium]|nr:MAG: GFA family protein [Nevskiaceae bacterium]TBR74461.1 MAG: GFA family protein [Nevskiaceae bacterium]
MSNDKTYHGSCFCGAVRFTVTGEPVAMGYCHCNDCRHWSASPVNGFTLWPKDALKVTQGEELIGTYHKTDNSHRKWCTKCGGHLFNAHPTMGLVDVFSSVTPDFPHKPAVHVYYGETVLHVKDGLPKMKDLPAEFGGSGATLPE